MRGFSKNKNNNKKKKELDKKSVPFVWNAVIQWHLGILSVQIFVLLSISLLYILINLIILLPPNFWMIIYVFIL